MNAMKKYPNEWINVEGDRTIHEFQIKDIEIMKLTEAQYDVLDNTEGIEIHEQIMNEVYRIEHKK
jgi:hypothetical protein